MTDPAFPPPAASRSRSHGPGPFVTHRTRPLPEGGHLVATSRRHRKGLEPHHVSDHEAAKRPPPSRPAAFHHLFAPQRLAWWIAVLFAIGSTCFCVAGAAAAWPDAAPGWLRATAVLNRVFVVGAIFFTTAAWLQWLEAINGDVSDALRNSSPAHWRWFGWRPRNLGYLASAIQLVGTVMFNFNTLDATFPGLTWQREDLIVWVPNMAGCICFLVSSYVAFAEVSQGTTSFAPRSISWWIAVSNLVGSVAFQVSALYSIAGPEPAAASALFRANVYTSAGGLCFLLGSYLMIPELFDEEAAGPATSGS